MRKRPRVILAGYFVRCPLGGYVWQALHYLKGFERLGCEVFFYEETAHFSEAFDPISGETGTTYEYGCGQIASVLERFGLANRWAFWDTWNDRYYGMSEEQTNRVFTEADVFVNLAGVNRLGSRPRPPACLYIDIDPAFTQIRLESGDAGLRELLAEHDLHFTFGENIGSERSPLPTGGIRWRPARPVVLCDLWENALRPASGAFSTIGKWDAAGRDVVFRGERYEWRKSREWMKFIELPRQSGERFDLAMDVSSVPADLERLVACGWTVRDPFGVSKSVDAYRTYIQESKGEFSAAKDMNVRLRSGWFSDRSACYLAAGRPVVVQDTGFGDVLPTGLGLFAVSGIEDALEAVASIRADYGAQCRAARDLARKYFEPEATLRPMLEAAGF